MPVEPFRLFDATVTAIEPVGRSLRRFTFGGPDLAHFADNGADQRIKLVLPLPDGRFSELPQGSDWYTAWRSLPDADRNPLRTYTVRRVRRDRAEVDVDMVAHGDGEHGGPGARFAAGATVGDPIRLFGPDARYEGEHGGIEWRPPAGTSRLLLAGDESALPAIASICESLPAGSAGVAFVEVADAADVIPVRTDLDVRWLFRGDRPHGELLVPAVAEEVRRLVPAGSAQPLAEVDVDEELLWEVPETAVDSGVYAWIAGEAAAVRELRRLLVREHGLDRSVVAFMGYWRHGRAETI